MDQVGSLGIHQRWFRPARRHVAALLLLAAAVVVAFAETPTFAFVNWDDEPLLLANGAYRGFGLGQLRWMFTTTLGGHHQPLTWLSFAVDHAIWGLSPGGFHLTNLVLHLANAIAFYHVVRLLLKARSSTHAAAYVDLTAVVAATLFAIHPLRVESVAWITERRDVLSGAFLLASLALYLSYATEARRSQGFLAAAFACFILSLLSKASGIVFPLVLLALDVFPLGRLVQWRGARADDRRDSIGRVLLEKAMFAVPAFAAAMLALRAQSEAGALWTFDEHPLALRLGQACYGAMFYLWKTVLPSGLSPLYEQLPGARALDGGNVLGAIFLVGVSILTWAVRKRVPALLSAWVCYLLLLLPVLGLAQSGPQLVADRYSYLSCMPWMVLVAAGLSRALHAGDFRHWFYRVAIVGVSAAIVILLIALTRQQARIWRNSETLWAGVLERAPRTGLAHASLAALLNQQGRHEQAKAHAIEALAILPGNGAAHVALATASLALGDASTAETHYRRAIEIARHLGRTDASSISRLAQTLASAGRADEAIELYRSLAEFAPETADWPLAVGTLLAKQGKLDESRDWFQRAMAIAPDSATASLRLGVVWLKLGQAAKAVQAWEIGLRYSPEDREILSQMAWTLATTRDEGMRDPARAKGIATALVERSDAEGSTRAKEALAAALAAEGDFAGARQLIEELLAQAAETAGPAARMRWERQRETYEAGEALRE